MQHRRTLMRSAILMEREAETWADGWSVNGHWDKEGQWAKARYDDLMKHAMHLKAIALSLDPSASEVDKRAHEALAEPAPAAKDAGGR
jgi:hypothetical protein